MSKTKNKKQETKDNRPHVKIDITIWKALNKVSQKTRIPISEMVNEELRCLIKDIIAYQPEDFLSIHKSYNKEKNHEKLKDLSALRQIVADFSKPIENEKGENNYEK